jgi:hypothetical protein
MSATRRRYRSEQTHAMHNNNETMDYTYTFIAFIHVLLYFVYVTGTHRQVQIINTVVDIQMI